MIGKKFYIYDINLRVYEDPETGEKSSGPIWKYSWRECEIVSETRVSWIDNWDKKYKKKDFKEKYHLSFSRDGINKIVEIKEIKRKLRYEIDYGFRNEVPQNYKKFKQIEELISSLEKMQ